MPTYNRCAALQTMSNRTTNSLLLVVFIALHPNMGTQFPYMLLVSVTMRYVGASLPLSSTGCVSKHSYHCTTLPIKKAHEPQKVANEASYWAPLLPYAGPRAPHSCRRSVSQAWKMCSNQQEVAITVNPKAPIKFHRPICHPSTFGAGMYHFDWVSSMNRTLVAC